MAKNMSGFCGSNDSEESSPVEKDSGESIRIPPGFRFFPTDEELIAYYLLRKIASRSLEPWDVCVEEGDLYSLEPWDVCVDKRERFFFNPRDMKDSTGRRIDRSTHSGLGYWKPTGTDGEIFMGETLIGMKKTLIFYRGRAPGGERTDWVMHEYRLEGDISLHNLPQNAKNEWVICKVFLKSSLEKNTYNIHPGILELKLAEIYSTLFMNLIFLAIQTVAWASKSNIDHDFSTDEAEVGKHNVYCCRRSTLKRKDNNNEYVGGVRQLQPKLQIIQQWIKSSMYSHKNTTMEEYSRVRVKVRYNNDTVMFLLPFATMDSLKAEILKRFNMLESANFSILYKDEDEDMVTIACDEDLHYCLEFFKSTGTTPIILLSLSI